MSKDLSKSENGLSLRLITHVKNSHEIFLEWWILFQTVIEIAIYCAEMVVLLSLNMAYKAELLVRIFIKGKMRSARRS